MNTSKLTMRSLFDQLGLASSDTAIIDFLLAHSPLHPTVPLYKSLFWNKAQVAFLQQAIAEDSEWCALADELDACLRHGTVE